MLIDAELFATDTLRELGVNLYMLRHTKGITLKELSEKLNTDQNTLERLELGKYAPNSQVDLDLVFKIVRTFNAKIEISISNE